MSQHHQLIPMQDTVDCPEDDNDYIVQTTQDRLKRKRQRYFKILLICGCVCLLIISTIAVTVGVLLGGAKNKTDHNGKNATDNIAGTIHDTNLLHFSTIRISIAYSASTDLTMTDTHTRPIGTSSSSLRVTTSSHNFIASTTSPVTATSVLTNAHIRSTTSSRTTNGAHIHATVTNLLHSSTTRISTGYSASTDTPEDTPHTRPGSIGTSSSSRRVTTSSHNFIASTTSLATATSVLTNAHIRSTSSSRITNGAHTNLLHSSTIRISTGYSASTDRTDTPHTRPGSIGTSSSSRRVTTSSHNFIASSTSSITTTSVLTNAHIRSTISSLITSGTHTFTSSMTPTPTTMPTPPPGDMVNSNVLNYIDTYYEPCEDFYKYSCGNWRNSHPSAAEWGAFEDLALDNYNKIAGYLSRYVSSRDPDAIKKAKYIYSACTDTDYIEDNYLNMAKSFMITEGGGWEHGGLSPSHSWSIDSNLYKDHYLGSSAFFSFGIVPDDLNSSKPVITVSQGGLTYSPEKYFDNDYNLGSLIKAVLDAFDPYGYHYTTAHNIANFEYALASHWVSKTELHNATATYNPMTLDELAEIFSMDWINYFNKYFEKAGYSGNFNGSTVVIVNTPSYFRAINRYLTRSTVEDYAKWQLLLHAISLYIAPLPRGNWKILRDIKFPKTAKLSLNTKLSCIELIENTMPLAVARPFVEEFITSSMKVQVGDVAEQLKIAFKQRILEKDWLDETTKNRTIEKVDAITEQIAYPDFIKFDRQLNLIYEELNISRGITYFSAVSAMYKFVHKKMVSRYFHPIDKTKWLDSPTGVNAYYSPQFNQFVILAGILRPPFYAANWYPFLMYGALGAVIGHELTHGFDDNGQQYNKDGNRVKWWTDHSIRNFRERTQCFVDQYNQYSLQGYSIDGQFTLGENIADNGGVHAAFRAYKNVMNGASENVRGHSGDQLFFVAFAQLWCSSFTDDALESDISTDPHSPGPIRVLGSLVNSEEFTNAFQCSRGSRMYPNDDRCELW